ncbi:hypothetical protein AX15_000183 [Amanita polypyramis BW_CC]|nr:hypothetical protein AX15_000183 [Amanita polypyramis BW_CC]
MDASRQFACLHPNFARATRAHIRPLSLPMRLLPPAPSTASNSLPDECGHNSPGTPHDSPSTDAASETDAEVDQLDSDSDMDEVGSASSTDRNEGIRPPGCSLLPSDRLENILQADGVTGNLALSKEALFILSVATEEYIKRMTRTGHIHASAQRRNTVEYVDMAASTQQYQEFMFLKDTIPSPISLTEAIQLRQAKEKEMLEDDPALAINPSLPVMFPSQNGSSKGKGKGRSAANGHGKINGEANMSAWQSERNYKPVNELLPTPPWPGNMARNGSTPVLSPANMSPFVNGEMPAPPAMPHAILGPPREPYEAHPGHVPLHQMYYPQPNVVPDRPEHAWLRGPGLVDPDHLGRTIYSKDRHGG